MTMRPINRPKCVIFDGDDTLWDTQPIYDDVKKEFFSYMCELLGSEPTETSVLLRDIDLANRATHALSSTRFSLSLTQTYSRLCAGTAVDVDPIVRNELWQLGQSVFNQVASTRPDADEVLSLLGRDYSLILFTAGPSEVQRKRVDDSRLVDHFAHVVITPEKTRDRWSALLESLDPKPTVTWSVGNSPRSDILPALELGLSCIFVDGGLWAGEQAPIPIHLSSERLFRCASLTEVAESILGENHREPR